MPLPAGAPEARRGDFKKNEKVWGKKYRKKLRLREKK
jgi:hypothetical protein